MNALSREVAVLFIKRHLLFGKKSRFFIIMVRYGTYILPLGKPEVECIYFPKAYLHFNNNCLQRVPGIMHYLNEYSELKLQR